jgi:hypothetical protein
MHASPVYLFMHLKVHFSHLKPRSAGDGYIWPGHGLVSVGEQLMEEARQFEYDVFFSVVDSTSMTSTVQTYQAVRLIPG